MIIWEPEHAAFINTWIDQRGGGKAFPGSFTAIGHVSGDVFQGGIVFHDTNGVNCSVNIAVEGRFLSPALLKAGLWYSFGQLKLKRLTFIIKAGNIRSIELVSRLGAIHEATLQDADINGNLLIYALFPKNCKIWRRMWAEKAEAHLIP